MNEIINDFNERVEEIKLYISFIKLFDKNKKFLLLDINEEREINLETYKILKANIYLLLYNIIESTIRKSLFKIREEITQKNIIYINVKNEIKKLYLNSKYYNFDGNKGIPEGKNKNDYILEVIDNIYNEVIKFPTSIIKNQKQSTKDELKIAGNIDTKKIREFANEYGFFNATIDKCDNLHIVMNKRNSLAHGRETFSECGKEKTIEEFETIYNNSTEYMEKVLKRIKEYLDNQEYLK